MTSSVRSSAMFVLTCLMAVAIVGCAAAPRESSARPKALRDITTTVPKLAGIPLANAEKVLAFVALRVGRVTIEETKDASLQGKVFEQDPAPGTIVRGGTRVNLKVHRFVSKAGETLPAQTK